MLFLSLLVLAAPLQPHEVPNELFLDRSGFPELVIHTSIAGGLLGYAAGDAFQLNDTVATAAFAAGVGIGVVVPLVLLHGESVHAPQAAFYNLGERWGAITGGLLPTLFNIRQSRYSLGLAAISGVGGLGFSVYLYPKLHLTPGQVSSIGSAHIFSSLGTVLLLSLYDVVFDNGTSFAAPILGVSTAAMLGTYLLRDLLDIDRRRVIWTDIGGYVGLAAGMGAGFFIAGRQGFSGGHQIYAASMLTGMLVGLVTARYFSSDLDSYLQAVDLPEGTAAPASSVDSPIDFRGKQLWMFSLGGFRW